MKEKSLAFQQIVDTKKWQTLKSICAKITTDSPPNNQTQTDTKIKNTMTGYE